MCGRLSPSSSSSVLSPGQENVRRSIRLPALLAVEVQANPVGRPRLDAEIRHLIRRMARENPTWGRRRIRAELALLGYEVAELTVAKYMHRTSPRPSPTWRAFLAAHARDIVAVDFFLVPTLTFRLLVRLRRASAMTAANSSTSTSRITPRQSGPPGRSSRRSRTRPAPRYLLRDRDAIYGEDFTR